MLALIHEHILPAASALLPGRLNTPESRALMLTIALQESKCIARRQTGGPARGFWQFEGGPMSGTAQVLTHPATRLMALDALSQLHYKHPRPDIDPTAYREFVYARLEDNDVLAAVMARLLLYADPKPLPAEVLGAEAGWLAYKRNWHPGQPHRETWDTYWSTGWALGR